MNEIKWVSVKEALPPIKTRVLIVARSCKRYVGVSSITSIMPNGKPKWAGREAATHWAYMPALPSEGTA